MSTAQKSSVGLPEPKPEPSFRELLEDMVRRLGLNYVLEVLVDINQDRILELADSETVDREQLRKALNTNRSLLDLWRLTA